MQAYRVDLDTNLLSTLARSSSSLPQRFSLTGQLARPVFDRVLVAPGKEFLLRMNPVSTPAPLTLYLGKYHTPLQEEKKKGEEKKRKEKKKLTSIWL